jgi:aminopeptidase
MVRGSTMSDPRSKKLADLIVRHSLELRPGEAVLIEAFDLADGLVLDLIESVHAVSGLPLVSIRSNAAIRAQLVGASEALLKRVAAVEMAQMQQVQAYVGIRAMPNVSELSDVPGDRMDLYLKHVVKPVHLEHRVEKTRWVVLRHPNPSMAQLAGMSTRAFEDFYYRVCTLDYSRMAEAMEPLKRRMERTDRVRITGPGTDLSFSIRGIPAIKCEGRRNIPDGECYTAPVRDSVHGTITYNTPSLYMGPTFDGIRFRFENGRIVEAQGTPQTRLDEILDSDDGARYVGEFSLGFHPFITQPMKDTLFDEKIAGSLHFTPGNAYSQADNGNRSRVHWDLVLIQTPEFGGGEVWFDDTCIRKDGRFVVPELEDLNPERLGA